MSWLPNIQSINRYNAAVWRRSTVSELSGAFGDMGTLLPLMIAMALKGSIDLSSTLVFSGLANVLTGLWFGIPLPVQPMKAIAAVAISRNFSKEETTAAGLTVGFMVLFLSCTGLLRWLHRVVPIPVVRGIQMGAGLSLVISAGTTMLALLHWVKPENDNRIIALIAFLFLIFASLRPGVPYAIIVLVVGLIISAWSGGIYMPGVDDPATRFWDLHAIVPSREAWSTGALDAALPQLPLTTLNSILAVTSLAAALFPEYPPAPSTTSLGLSVAFANIIGCWFGAMPICHGSGGLAAQFRFGARSGSSIIFLGALKIVLGLFAGSTIVPLLQHFPKSLLGLMVLAAGVELAKVGRRVNELGGTVQLRDEDDYAPSTPQHSDEEKWTVMLITAAGCLAFKNDAVGFIAGLLWHWSIHLRNSTSTTSLRARNARGDEEDPEASPLQ